MVVEFLEQYGLELLAALLTALFGYLGIALNHLTRRFFDDETKLQVAATTVRFVQQVYRDLDGPAKYEKALQEACLRLSKKGIPTTPEELRPLLEAAVHQLKQPLPAPKPEA